MYYEMEHWECEVSRQNDATVIEIQSVRSEK